MSMSLSRNRLVARYFIVFSGYCLAVGFCLVLCFTFFVAFFNGGSVVISVDRFGEMGVEFFLIPLVMFFVLLGLFFCWRDLVEKAKVL